MHIMVSNFGYWKTGDGWVTDINLATRFTDCSVPISNDSSWINTANEAVIFIEKRSARELQDLLDRVEINFHEEKIAEDALLAVFRAKFDNGYEADIKVCSGQNNCFIDPILFDEEGRQACLIDAEFDLLGVYEFEAEGVIYKVELKEREE